MRIEFYQGGWWYVKGRVWHHICWLEESRVASKENRRRGGAGIWPAPGERVGGAN
jgi:hypothetical protein